MPPARLPARPASQPADRLWALRPGVELRAEDMGMTEPIRKWKTGDRVTLTLRGRVEYDRSGFVRVQWDDREASSEWGTDLVPEPANTEEAA